MHPTAISKHPISRRPARRPVSPTPLDRMTDALIVRSCNYDDVTSAKAILRHAGFPTLQIEAMAGIALAAARARTCKR